MPDKDDDMSPDSHGAFQGLWNLRCKAIKEGKIIVLNKGKAKMKCMVKASLGITNILCNTA